MLCLCSLNKVYHEGSSDMFNLTHPPRAGGGHLVGSVGIRILFDFVLYFLAFWTNSAPYVWPSMDKQGTSTIIRAFGVPTILSSGYVSGCFSPRFGFRCERPLPFEIFFLVPWLFKLNPSFLYWTLIVMNCNMQEPPTAPETRFSRKYKTNWNCVRRNMQRLYRNECPMLFSMFAECLVNVFQLF